MAAITICSDFGAPQNKLWCCFHCFPIYLPWSDGGWIILRRPTRPSRTNTPKSVLFIIGDWDAKVGSQETPGVTGKFGLGIQNEAGQRLIEFRQKNTLVIANTLFQQHKRTLHMDITRWSTPKSDWLYSLQQRWRSSIQSGKTRPGTDCGSDHELLIAKFRLKLKKVGKILEHSGTA